MSMLTGPKTSWTFVTKKSPFKILPFASFEDKSGADLVEECVEREKDAICRFGDAFIRPIGIQRTLNEQALEQEYSKSLAEQNINESTNEADESGGYSSETALENEEANTQTEDTAEFVSNIDLDAEIEDADDVGSSNSYPYAITHDPERNIENCPSSEAFSGTDQSLRTIVSSQ